MTTFVTARITKETESRLRSLIGTTCTHKFGCFKIIGVKWNYKKHRYEYHVRMINSNYAFLDAVTIYEAKKGEKP